MALQAAILRATLLFVVVWTPGTPAEASVEPEWGLPPGLSSRLARSAETYGVRHPGRSRIEGIRGSRYRPRSLRAARQPDPLGETYGVRSIPEFRFHAEPPGRPRKGLPRRLRRFPTAHEWAGLFRAEHQPLFMYRLLDRRIEGFDLVLEIQFRGWLPFTDGADIREWEGIALVEATRLDLVEIRAQPRNQDARLAWLYDRWSRSFKITLGFFAGPLFLPAKTFRLAPPPLAYRCFVRFDVRDERTRLPSFVRYEIHRAVSRRRTERHSVATLHYSRAAGGGAGSEERPTAGP